MGTNQFFLGLIAGVAMLVFPVLTIAFGISPLDLPNRVGAWIEQPTQRQAHAASDVEVAGVTRPHSGYVPGQATATPLPLPTLEAASIPGGSGTGARAAAGAGQGQAPAANPVAASSWSHGVVTAPGGVRVLQAVGLESATDPLLAPGTPVYLSGSGTIRLNGQEWRSIRAHDNIVGWVPNGTVASAAVSPQAYVTGQYGAVQATPTAQGQGAAAARSRAGTTGSEPTVVHPGQRVRVANTDGSGVVFRNSPRAEDRTTQGLTEGAGATVLEWADSEWVRVRADNGAEGWLPARYLTAGG